ncbi:hypothetical protein CORC01_09010 [Colletotrichum orchidophilum]|uniref:Uncharacterized protein n=1 Tax=Colletotrichum orchidophilum TaxID=1209926 RepID=A0A1G4B2Z4_9PEZI|nr:uncharacterized protein CORC01_09010 [Colletotrichum orchidophilum]OHE95726.1 hypothetical protein CORC01_09010 [Colletotrichum orchidophilum]
MSRWRKRSQEKRRELLNKTVPELEELQWIIPRYGYSEEKDLLEARTIHNWRHLLLPWLNVEVLKTSPAVLFALLHYRTMYTPEDWAPLDCRQIELPWAAGLFNVDFSPKCVVMSGTRYGDVVDWEEGQAHTGYTLGFPRARLVLEAQALLLKTLSNITDAILEGVDTTIVVGRTDKWREQTLVGFHHPGEAELWSPYTYPAFSPPPRLDMDYLVSLAKTRKEEKRGVSLEKMLREITRYSKPNTKEHLESDPLDWCLVQMTGEPDNQRHFDHAMLFAMIDDHLSKSNRKEAARIDNLLMRELANLSAMHE